jgi:nitroreductase
MDVFEAILSRRSVRKFKPDDVSYETIMEILEAARWAPSSGNLQNWYFIVVKDPEKKLKLCKAALGQKFVAEAPVLIVVCSDPRKVEYIYGERGRRLYSIQNVAAAIENLLLAATAKGLGTCWVGAFNESEVKSALEIPDYIEVHAIIALGYPDESPKSSRRALDEIVFFERWGNSKYVPELYPLVEYFQKLIENLKRKS